MDGTVQDVTQEWLSKEALIKANKLIEKANASLLESNATILAEKSQSEEALLKLNRANEELIRAQNAEKEASLAKEQAITKLKQSEMRLSHHIQNTPVGCISWDRDFRCTEWNKAAETIFGHTLDQAVGRHAAELIVPPEIKADIDEVFQQLLTQKGGTRSTNENISRDGRVIHCDWYNTPITNASGDVIGVASLVTDITKNKKAEAMILQAKEDAEAANKAKSEFLATMSHEFRTPMNGILGMTDLILMSDLPDRMRSNLMIIKESGDMLLSLLNNILDLSKIEAGRVEIDLTELNIIELVDSLEAQFAPQVSKKNLQWSLNYVGDLDSPWIVTDNLRVRQVLTNLLSNAIKFTAEGEVTLTISQQTLPDGEVETRFEVKDTGIGMSEPQQKQVFDAFTQADQSITREFGGTGLGLSISRQLVELMGGQIDLKSEPGHGSTFWFTIPSGRMGTASSHNAEGTEKRA